jgi:hypothetical protein
VCENWESHSDVGEYSGRLECNDVSVKKCFPAL